MPRSQPSSPPQFPAPRTTTTTTTAAAAAAQTHPSLLHHDIISRLSCLFHAAFTYFTLSFVILYIILIFLSTTARSWCPHLKPSPSDLLAPAYKSCRHTELYCPNPYSPNSNSNTGDFNARNLAPTQQREGEREVQSLHWLISFPFWLGSSNDVMFLVFSPSPHPVPAYPQILSLPPILLIFPLFPSSTQSNIGTHSSLGEVTASSG